MKNLRSHGKSTIVWVLMGLMVLGLGGFGVTNFTGGTSSIGSVGNTKITANEYSRALRNQVNAYQQQAGEPITMAQAQQMGLTQNVQAQLFTAAALQEQARLIGISVGDDRVRETIAGIPAFRGPTGNFDRAAYTDVLRNQRMNEAEFERTVRTDEARLLLQRAVVGGVTAPEPLVDMTANWILEGRDLSWRELTADQLTTPIEDPSDQTLETWHSANADRFTAPEVRRITYVWATPERLASEVELDEAALREVYEANRAEFQKPERRFVSRLVMPTQEAAEQAKAQIDAGEMSFEDVVRERGLTLEDAELGERTRESLGDAGEAVFALAEPGVTEPVQTNLGPALFAIHAVLEPVDIPFEQAQEDLRAEAALDRAARLLNDRSHDYEDMLAGGAALEQMAEETEMEIGQIDWIAENAPEEGSIAGYESFRTAAAELTEGDFPAVLQLEDGGRFALRLDEVVAPTLRPFDEVRDEVLEDWRRAEQHRMLLTLAEAQATEDSAPAPEATEQSGGADAEPARVWTEVTGVTRDGWVDGAPEDVVVEAFEMTEQGEIQVVDSEGRVILLRLDAINAADLAADHAQRIVEAVRFRIGSTMEADIFDYYARAAQRSGGLSINQTAINAAESQVQ